MSIFRYPTKETATDAVLGVFKHSASTTSPGVLVSPTDALVLNTNLVTWNVSEASAGSFAYEIIDSTHLNIIMPATADATNGDHIIYATANKAPGQTFFYIIIQKGNTPPVISGSWESPDGPEFPHIIVQIPNGNTSAQNNVLLQAALLADSRFTSNVDFPQTATLYAGGEFLSPETTTGLLLRKNGSVVTANMQKAAITNFSGTTEGVFVQIPAAFLPSPEVDRTLQNCELIMPDSSIISGHVSLTSDGKLAIYPMNSDKGFLNGTSFSIGDISCSWIVGTFPS